MRKFMTILCLLLAMVCVLSACGGAKEEPKEDGKTTEGKGEKNPNAGITLDFNAMELEVGKSAEVEATFVPAYEGDDTTLSLEVEDTSIATVDGMTVTAVAPGETKVTVKNADGSYTATFKVGVVAKEQIFTVIYDGTTETKDVTANINEAFEVNFGVNFESGKKLRIKLPEGQKYLAVTIGTGVAEAILYVPNGMYEYTIPADYTAIYPSNFAKGGKVSVRIPTDAELTAKHNLALNPYDNTAAKSAVFPHVTSNNEYNKNEFAARCAIDGFTQNNGHGRYPVQSWGPKEVVKATDHFTVDFGRTVLVNELTVYLRGDFGHDAYYSTIVVEFSDGSTEVIKPTMVKDGQKFTFAVKETDSVKLTGFVVDSKKGGPWTGRAELEIHGMEKLG